MAASPVGLDISKGVVLNSRATGITQSRGDQPGAQTADELISAIGTNKAAIQGVKYGTALLTNILPGGCDPGEAKDFATLLSGAAQSCPSPKLVQLSSSARARIFAAAVTYGETQKRQDGGKIPNFDASKTLILCNTGDLVCDGTLIITSDHLSHISSVPSGVN
ncbi:carbohydrate esterase family 5 protein [Xylaria longipes]|nr:carbohydrate esterase family 5 protein [Xylaria longipes]